MEIQTRIRKCFSLSNLKLRIMSRSSELFLGKTESLLNILLLCVSDEGAILLSTPDLLGFQKFSENLDYKYEV